jgi:nitroreductase
MELTEVIRKRQSIRNFTQETISEEHLKALLEAAYNAPIGRASYHRYELVIINNTKKIELITNLVNEVTGLLKQPFFNAPLVIFVTGQPNRERLDGCDTGCVIENIMLQATNLGLGSCFLYTISEIINNNVKIQQALELPSGYSVMSAVVIGHPQEKDLPLKVRPGIKTRIV